MTTGISFAHLTAIATLILLVPVPIAAGQDARIPRDEYFRLIGQYDDFAALQTLLNKRLAERRPDLDEARRIQMAEFFAFVMTACGLNAHELRVLEDEGIDVVRAITANTRPFGEQSLLSDLVVVGDVIEGEVRHDVNDGYDLSALVDVRWTLKGHAPSDTIVIRLRERSARSARDIRPETGRTYLLLLSGGMYRYNAANHAARNDGWLPSEPYPALYSIYRIYPMVDDRLDWSGFTRDETQRALEDIRRVEHFLSVHRLENE